MENALRAIGVVDPAVLAAMAAVPRERFVPGDLAEEAGENRPLPIGHGQTISAPDVVGWMTQALRVGPGDRVLEIGTGSGYQAAVLAALGCRVFSVERIASLAEAAARRLADLGFDTVRVRSGDGAPGWPGEAPFDGVVVTAAADAVPPALVDQLRPGGRLVIPVGPAGGIQHLRVLTRLPDGGVRGEPGFPVRFVPLISG